MVPLKVEETLHDYLRRHFEKVSKGNARQFAEQREIPKVEVVPDTRTSGGNGSYAIARPLTQTIECPGVAWFTVEDLEGAECIRRYTPRSPL
jgi:hypothetical protein